MWISSEEARIVGYYSKNNWRRGLKIISKMIAQGKWFEFFFSQIKKSHLKIRRVLVKLEPKSQKRKSDWGLRIRGIFGQCTAKRYFE